MATQEIRFASCTLRNLDKTFKMKRVQVLPSLDAWLAMLPGQTISDWERQTLLHYQRVLDFNVHDWMTGMSMSLIHILLDLFFRLSISRQLSLTTLGNATSKRLSITPCSLAGSMG